MKEKQPQNKTNLFITNNKKKQQQEKNYYIKIFENLTYKKRTLKMNKKKMNKTTRTIPRIN